MVVHRGDEVTLECVTNMDVSCAWKIDAPELEPTGFLMLDVSERTSAFQMLTIVLLAGFCVHICVHISV